MIGMAIVQAALLTLASASDFSSHSLDSFLVPGGEEGRYFPTISNTSLVITYTTAIVAALMLGSFLWVAASFGQGGEAAGGYGNYRKKREAPTQDVGQKLTLVSDVWSRQQEEEVGRAEEQLWEAWRRKEEEEGMQLREAFKLHGMEGQDENCQLLVACLSAVKLTNKNPVASQIHKIIRSISSKRPRRLVHPHHNSIEGNFTERVFEAHRRGGLESSDCGNLYKGSNCHSQEK